MGFGYTESYWWKKIRVLPDVPEFLIQKGQGFIGKVFNRSGQVITDNWKFHEAIIKNDMVYDRITGPTGMHLNEYKKLFELGDDLIFKLLE